MQFVADPGLTEPLAVAFNPDIALGWQRRAHVGKRLSALLLDAGQWFGRQYFVLAWPATLALRRLGRGRIVRGPAEGFLARFDLRGVTRQMTDDMAVQMTTDELLMHPFGQALRGELGEGAREGCLAGHIGASFPAAYTSQRAVDLQTLDQGGCGWDGEHGLGDEAAGDGGAVIWWPATAA